MLRPNRLIINEFGLENVQGLRNADDGIVHFGSRKVIDDNVLDKLKMLRHGTLKNDYVFKSPSEGPPINFGDRHFSIMYKRDINKYMLLDSGMGSGTFLKI